LQWLVSREAIWPEFDLYKYGAVRILLFE